jgi:hypothetical protein
MNSVEVMTMLRSHHYLTKIKLMTMVFIGFSNDTSDT